MLSKIGGHKTIKHSLSNGFLYGNHIIDIDVLCQPVAFGQWIVMQTNDVLARKTGIDCHFIKLSRGNEFGIVMRTAIKQA